MLRLDVEPLEGGSEGLARRLIDGIADLWPLDRDDGDGATCGIADQRLRNHVMFSFST